MWRLKNEWYKRRKQDRIMFIILMITIIVGLIYSFIAAKTQHELNLPVIEHTVSECQHEEYWEICDSLKQIYGEDSSIKYSLQKTLNCTEPLTLYLNNQEVQIWIESTSNDNTGEQIQLITGISSIVITGILFLVSYFIVKAFKKHSYITMAIVTNIVEEEYYNKRFGEYRTINVYEYEYRDRDYKLQTGQTKALIEHQIGDKFEIIHLANNPSKSISKFMFKFVQFIPYVLLLVFIVICSIWGPTVLNILT